MAIVQISSLPWYEIMCELVAKGRHLHILKWVIDHCPPDPNITLCKSIIEKYNPDLLEYINQLPNSWNELIYI